MKKAICFVVIVIAMLFAGALPGQAQWHGQGHGQTQWHGHGHSSFSGGVWIGPGWGGWGPWWWGYPAYPYGYPYGAYPYGYSEPPVVMQEQRQVYSQAAPQAEEQNYWYFCPDPQGYYPYVKRCPKGWLRVIPPSAPPDWRE